MNAARRAIAGLAAFATIAASGASEGPPADGASLERAPDPARIERRTIPGATPIIEVFPGPDEWPPLRDPPRWRPDERELWALVHAERPALALSTIEAWRRRVPAWTPPDDLVRICREQLFVRALERARDARRMRVVESLALLHPEHFDCAHVDRLWLLADAKAERDAHGDALAVHARIVRTCEDPRARVATLERARAQLGDDAALALVDLERGRLDGGTRSPRVDALLLAIRSARLVEAARDADDRRFLATESEVRDALVATRDDELALVAGWHHLSQRRPDEAVGWFERAVSWSPEREDAAWGLALALRQAGEDERALAVAERWADLSARLGTLAGTILGERASAHDDPEKRLALLRAAAHHRAPSNDQRRHEAWTLHELGRDDEAATIFESLYREERDDASARGLAASLEGEAPQRVGRLADELGGPLAAIDEERRARNELAAGRPLTAHELAARVDPSLANVDALSLGGALGLRFKSGEPGLGRLRVARLPIGLLREVRRGRHRFDLELDLVELDAGTPRDVARLGSAPRGDVAPMRSPFTRTDGQLAGRVAWTREGPSAPHARLGLTPGGPAGRRPTVEVGWTWSGAWGLARIDLLHLPVRESLLSFVGQRDPFSEREWGGVMRSGASAFSWTPLAPRWGVSATAGWERRAGEGVVDNARWSGSVSLGRNFEVPGFAYLSFGPYVLGEGYQRNASGYTLGHGGYFSPRLLLDAGIAADFLTLETRPLVIEGRASVGYDAHRVEDAPLLPGTDDPRSLEGGRDSGVAYGLELLAVWQPRSRWQLGAGVSLRETGGFADRALVLVVRRAGAARSGAFRMDLPKDLVRSLR